MPRLVRCRRARHSRGVAQLGLARLHGVQEVAGSNPVAPKVHRNPVFDNDYAPADSEPLYDR